MPEPQTVQERVDQLQLQRLDHEGGWYRRIHTAPTVDGRPASTTIYALFTAREFSALHRLDADEQFFFVDGDPFETFQINFDGAAAQYRLGRDFATGESPHLSFPAGTWFGGRPASNGGRGWSLIACVVTPGFTWQGFELARRSDLCVQFPQHREAIRYLTRT